MTRKHKGGTEALNGDGKVLKRCWNALEGDGETFKGDEKALYDDGKALMSNGGVFKW